MDYQIDNNLLMNLNNKLEVVMIIKVLLMKKNFWVYFLIDF
jgi:hypothetical protein